MKKLPAIDQKGRPVHKNDWVRIVEVPKEVSTSKFRDTKLVFKKSLGKTFKVEQFGRYGHLELDVWKKLKLKSMDTIAIEPRCVIRTRSKKF